MAPKKKTVKVNNSGGSRVPTKPSKGGTGKGLIPDDYVYAIEVANQPAETRREQLYKLQAKLDVAELKRRYPYIRKNWDIKGSTVSIDNKTYPV